MTKQSSFFQKQTQIPKERFEKMIGQLTTEIIKIAKTPSPKPPKNYLDKRTELVEELRAVSLEAEAEALGMDFGLLYDASVRHLYIGYNVSADQMEGRSSSAKAASSFSCKSPYGTTSISSTAAMVLPL